MITEKGVDNKGNRFHKIIIEPTSYPITVEEVKEFARIDGNEEDTLLETFIDSVVKLIENYLNRSLLTRTIRMIMDEWNSKEVELPQPPLISVSSIETIDESDIATTYSSDNYYVITESIPGRIIIKKDVMMPINTDRYSGGFRITYLAGYGSASQVPKQIKTAIMQWVTTLYENRNMTENELIGNIIKQVDVPLEIQKILKPFRVIRI